MKNLILVVIVVVTGFNSTYSQNLNPYEELGYKTKNQYVRTKKDDGLWLYNKDTLSKVQHLLISLKTKQLFVLNNKDSIILVANIPEDALTRFLSVDPLTKKYPELTPYQFASNTPIQAIDLDGLERLDVSAFNTSKRSASIQIVKNVYINSNNINSQLSALGNSTFSSIFSSGNTSLYVSAMPQNGQPLKFIDRNTYNKGTGYKLDVTYNVTLQNTTDPSTVDVTNAANSLVQTGTATKFSNPLTFARADANTTGGRTNNVYINPNYIGFSPPVEWDASAVPSFEELVAHEVGFHNMARQLHTPDRMGNAIYPTGRTLESNLPGQIRPNTNNTQAILNSALQSNNLNDPKNLLPKSPATPTTTLSSSTPRIYN